MNSEFFATLGQYVYKYVDDDGKLLYVGKGNGDRCLAHLKDKGFVIEHCIIVAKNLELFEDKKDWQSFLLESFLIATENPEQNSVAGHYKECFVMTSLSSMFANFQSDQHDNFETFPAWYVENYDDFRGKLREVKVWSNSTFFLSNARNYINMMWYWTPNGETPIKVTFEVNRPIGDELETMKETLRQWFRKMGYKKISEEGKAQKIGIECKSMEDVLSVWRQFNA